MPSKKTLYTKFSIPVDVFKTGILVLITRDTTKACKDVNKWFEGEFEEWDAYSVDGKTLSKEGYHPIIWLREPPTTAYWQSCLMHEVTHAVARIMERMKVPLNYSNEEVYTYLGEYIFHEILRRYTK